MRALPRLWYDHEQTVGTAGPCIEACKKTGLGEIIFTMWGDDGGYCDFDSAFAGMAWTADYAFNGKSEDGRVERFFRSVFGSSYKLQLAAWELEISIFKEGGGPHYDILAGPVLWDDPLMGIIWHEYLFFDKNVWDVAIRKLRQVAGSISPHRDDAKAGHINHAWNICNTLIRKLEFRTALLKAYHENDRAALLRLEGKDISDVIEAIQMLNESFRIQWTRSYKSYGLEVMQIRLAGLCERYCETGRRISEYLDGKTASIHELELKPETRGFVDSRYRMIATGGWFI